MKLPIKRYQYRLDNYILLKEIKKRYPKTWNNDTIEPMKKYYFS